MVNDILIDRELQACPFCGSADIKVKGYPHTVTYHGQKHWFIICNECGGQTKKCYGNVDKAIDAWNKRTRTIPVGNGEDYEVTHNECG